MKKILFITTRNPYSGRYSGDVIRAKKIIEHLRKKNSVVAVFLTEKNEITKVDKKEKNIFFESPNIIKKYFIASQIFSNLSLYNLVYFTRMIWQIT